MLYVIVLSTQHRDDFYSQYVKEYYLSTHQNEKLAKEKTSVYNKKLKLFPSNGFFSTEQCNGGSVILNEKSYTILDGGASLKIIEIPDLEK